MRPFHGLRLLPARCYLVVGDEALQAADGDGFVNLPSLALPFARVSADPSQDAGERHRPPDYLQGLFELAL